MTTAAPAFGTTIGNYIVRHPIGHGGMGSVYLVEHTILGRRAALKMLHPEMSSNQEMVQRFFNEARAASAIKSPGIVEIYDFGLAGDGSAYLVMELLEGDSLAMRLRRFRALPVPRALTVARQIASALAPAHHAGIVHRDLKPDNVFLVPDGEAAGGERAKLLDFGIAKLSGDGRGGGMNLTSSRMVMGSPYYISPEQCRGAGIVDGRADLYALGCILYECLAGRPPFVGEGFGELMGAHLHMPPPPLAGFVPGMPPEVEALVQRLLAKEPAQRLQTADDVAAILSELLRPRLEAAILRTATAPPWAVTGQAAAIIGFEGIALPSVSSLTLPPALPSTLRQRSGVATPRTSRTSLWLAGLGSAALPLFLIAFVLGRRPVTEAPVATAVPAVAAPAAVPAGALPAGVLPAGVLPAVISPAAAAAGALPAAVMERRTAGAAPTPGTPPTAFGPASARRRAGALPARLEGVGGPERDRGPADRGSEPVEEPILAEPLIPDEAPALPQTLSPAARDEGVGRVAARLRLCGEAVAARGEVHATLEVLPSGKVKRVRILQAPDPRVNACVAAILTQAHFEETRYGATFRTLVVLE